MDTPVNGGNGNALKQIQLPSVGQKFQLGGAVTCPAFAEKGKSLSSRVFRLSSCSCNYFPSHNQLATRISPESRPPPNNFLLFFFFLPSASLPTPTTTLRSTPHVKAAQRRQRHSKAFAKDKAECRKSSERCSTMTTEGIVRKAVCGQPRALRRVNPFRPQRLIEPSNR